MIHNRIYLSSETFICVHAYNPTSVVVAAVVVVVVVVGLARVLRTHMRAATLLHAGGGGAYRLVYVE